MSRLEVGQALGLNDIVDFLYPVGGNPYAQFPNTPTPAEIFPNTSWEIDMEYAGRTFVGSGDGYEFGATGGEEKHILTINEMPVHSHGGVRINWSDDDIPHTASALIDSQGNPVRGAPNISNARASIDYVNQTYTNTAGEGHPYSIMQPYRVVNIWKRMA